MAYNAEVVADSVSPNGQRLTTIVVTFPHFILPEMLTHRAFSRNSESSRAMPVEKRIGMALDDPVTPISWGANQSGMQAARELSPDDARRAEALWWYARDCAVIGAVGLNGGSGNLKNDALRARVRALQERYGVSDGGAPSEAVHKQAANRVLEPYVWETVVITSTNWDNFFGLRISPKAQPEIRHAARLMLAAMRGSVPTELQPGEWHLPFIRPDDRHLPIEQLQQMAVARCARISYLTHNGTRDPAKDIGLHDQLLHDRHMSPFEHIATPMSDDELAVEPRSGNFTGWNQYRQGLPGQAIFIPYEDDEIESV